MDQPRVRGEGLGDRRNRFVQFRPLRGEDPGGAVADVHLKNLIACSHCSPVGGLSFRVANCRAAGISAAAAR
jgi:hypothetical protein